MRSRTLALLSALPLALPLALTVALSLLPAAAAAAPAPSLDAALADLRRAEIDPARAVTLGSLRLDTGAARLHVIEGVAVPAVTPSGAVAEIVLLGRARLVLDAPDAVEAGQLELFTGSRRLDEEISEAVLVIANDTAADALLGRPGGGPLAPAELERARRLHATWLASPERRQLEVELSMLRDRLGEPFFAGYFAGWFRGTQLGDFLYTIEPEVPEQVTVGAFEPLELEEGERRKLERRLHRAQRRGKLRGERVEDLGHWNTWLSATRTGPDGAPRPGASGFEPRHYTLDVHVDKEHLRGSVRVDLRAVHGASRTVLFTASRDLVVRSARDGAGAPLPFLQGSGSTLVVLPAAPAAGEEVVVELSFDGALLSKFDRKSFQLVDTLGWYPRTGTVDLATYDLTLHRPSRIELVASGRRVDGGAEPGGAWERRRLDVPSIGVSFEMGSFRSEIVHAGDVEITLHVDHETGEILDREDRERVLEALSGSLAYFEEIYGPYPLDYLTVATAPRTFSQSLLGFVTLSSLMIADLGYVSYALGFEDPRTLVAHEVAHQWWGHRVAPKSYRDAWLSEATANYSALLYARNRLGTEELRYGRGPMADWQEALTATTADGRTYDSLGPLVLGDRLSSSFSEGGAYAAVVYDKGAVVLDMLSRFFGEETFVEMLGEINRVADHRPVSTEEFLTLAERLTGTDLDAFTSRYVYSTGLPEVYYHYDFAPAAEEGKWLITGTARLETPYRYRHRVVARDDGRLAVVREAIPQMEVADTLLVVPVQIACRVEGREPEKGARRRRGADEEQPNVLMGSHTLLRGAEVPLRFEIDHEPLELWLDRDEEVYARFYNERRHPKRMLYRGALAEMAAGRLDAAEERLAQALEAELFAGIELGEPTSEKDRAQMSRMLDALVVVEQVRLAHQQGRLDRAAERLARLESLVGRNDPSELREALRVAEARLALAHGDARAAYDRLRRASFARERVRDVEGLLLLAVAAHELGESGELAAALDALRDSGADVELLRTGAPADALARR